MEKMDKEYISELAVYAELDAGILDGKYIPSASIFIDLPFEFMELLRMLGNEKHAYDLIEYSIRHCMPILSNRQLDQKNGVYMEIEHKLRFYIRYKNMVSNITNYLHVLVHTVGYFTNRIRHHMDKYELSTDLVALLVVRDRPISKNIEIQVYNNYVDKKTGEWIYYD